MRLPWFPVVGSFGAGGTGGRRAGRGVMPRPAPRGLALLGLDDLVEDELAALDLVSAVVRQRRVAVLVDRVLAQDRLAVLDLEERVDHGLAVVALVAGVLDRLQHDAHGLVPVDRVRLGILAELGLVLLEEVLARLRVELGVERRVGDEGHLLGGRADLRAERGLSHAVRAEELRRRHRGVQVLPELHGVVLGDAAEEDAVGALPLDRAGQRAVVRGLRVDALVAEDRQALGLGRRDDVVRQALAVDLLVVQDVGLRAAVVLLVRDLRRRLDVVGGHDAPVGPLARGVVLVGLALVGALGARQADSGVRRRDLQDPGLIEDRDRDGRSAGVELAQVGDGRLVLRRLAGVAGGGARVPLAGRRGGVVERDVLDGVLAHLAAGLLKGELLAIDERDGLRTRVALQREARIDGQGGGAGASTRTAGAGAAAVLVVAATGSDSERQRGQQAGRARQVPYAQRVPSSRDRFRRERESKQGQGRGAMVTPPHHKVEMAVDHRPGRPTTAHPGRSGAPFHRRADNARLTETGAQPRRLAGEWAPSIFTATAMIMITEAIRNASMAFILKAQPTIQMQMAATMA